MASAAGTMLFDADTKALSRTSPAWPLSRAVSSAVARDIEEGNPDVASLRQQPEATTPPEAEPLRPKLS